MPLCQIILLTRSHMPTSKHQFLDDTKVKISSKNWRFLAGIWRFVYARLFGKEAFIIIFMIYFNILGSKVLVQ